MDDPHHVLVKAHYAELSGQYPDLVLEYKEGTWVIKGSLDFCATYEKIKIKESFQVEILISRKYPEILPIARETGGIIPRTFHRYEDDTLCLGAPSAIKIKFSEKPSLLGFVDNLLIPFLFSFSYWKENGVMPYGELSHGGKGLTEYYTNYFGVHSESVILAFLAMLALDKYRGHHDCPCGSGQIIRQCHGDALLKLKIIQNQDDFLCEYMANAGCDLSAVLPDRKCLAFIKKRLASMSRKVKMRTNSKIAISA
jgi:hypothetical protein